MTQGGGALHYGADVLREDIGRGLPVSAQGWSPSVGAQDLCLIQPVRILVGLSSALPCLLCSIL
jgi:hypothetical protein